MKNYLRTLAPILVSLLILTVGALCLNAQLTNPIEAHIDHSFVIGEKTLPRGEYTFRMEHDTTGVMSVEDQRGDNVAQFEVRQTTADHRPQHSELVFRKYGNAEFLSKIFEGGSRTGIALTETSKQEERIMSTGQHAMDHTEEQR